jgi:hypothetical protein
MMSKQRPATWLRSKMRKRRITKKRINPSSQVWWRLSTGTGYVQSALLITTSPTCTPIIRTCGRSQTTPSSRKVNGKANRHGTHYSTGARYLQLHFLNTFQPLLHFSVKSHFHLTHIQPIDTSTLFPSVTLQIHYILQDYLQKLVKNVAEKAGLGAKGYTNHSLRVTALTALTRSGTICSIFLHKWSKYFLSSNP